MISIELSFYANLQGEFGEVQKIQVEYPVRIHEVFYLFKTLNGDLAAPIFLEADIYLKDDYNLLLDGRHIDGYDGIATIIDHDAELAFFPKIGGGYC